MEIQVGDGFDLEQIADSGQCFRWERTGPHAYRIPHGRRCLHIARVSPDRYRLDCAPAEFRDLWRPYFDLDTDYREIRDRIDPAADPFLYRAAQAQRGIRILRQDPWETTVSFIISQNRNIPQIRRSVEKLCRAAGQLLPDGRGGGFYAFPGPEALLDLGEAGLDGCALGYRTKYVLAAARAAADGSLDFASLAADTPSGALARLTALYGVGPKVASCIALFGLHQTDAFPIDVWVRRVLENEYPAGYPYARYSPFNGIYQQYMFADYRSRRTAPGSLLSPGPAPAP